MRQPRALAALLVAALLLAALAASPALAEDAVAPDPAQTPAPAPVPSPAPAPTPPPVPPSKEGAGPAPDSKLAPSAGKEVNDIHSLEARLVEKWPVAAAYFGLRFGLFVAAVVLVILAALRRSEVRRGLLPPPVEPLPPVVPFTLPIAILLVVAWQAAAGGLSDAFEAHRPPWAPNATVATIVATAAPSLLLAVGILARRRWAREVLGRGPTSAGRAIRAGGWAYVVGSGAALAATIATLPLLRAFGVDLKPQALVLEAVDGPSLNAWVIALYGVLGAPLAEEAIFRGMLHPAARRWIGGSGATVVVALLFAAIHGSWVALAPLFVLALFLGWLLERTDSLLATWTVHALFNFTTLLPILLFRYL